MTAPDSQMRLTWGLGHLLFTLNEARTRWESDRHAPPETWMTLWDFGKSWHASHVCSGAASTCDTAQATLDGLWVDMQSRRAAMKQALEHNS